MTNKNKASAWLTIDLAALAANYTLFKSKVGKGTKVGGVIKANGYGLGVEKVLATLESQNCPFYFVATLEEALHIRGLTEKPIAVFGGLYQGAEEEYIYHNIIPVLNSVSDIDRWRNHAAAHEMPLQAIIHFDTGMNRLGLGSDETKELHDDQSKLEGLNVLFGISHFACADEKDHPLTGTQYERFVAATAPLGIKQCLANSSGILRSTDYHFDMVRPGIGLYGGNPTPETDNPMSPVVSLNARILQVRNVKQGESVGYGASHEFKGDTKIATIALGYADGFLRSLSNNGHVYYNGAACPIVGRVSMDAISIHVGHLSMVPKAGESVEILGPHQDVDTLANAAGTISYEILTDLGRRYHREYKH